MRNWTQFVADWIQDQNPIQCPVPVVTAVSVVRSQSLDSMYTYVDNSEKKTKRQKTKRREIGRKFVFCSLKTILLNKKCYMWKFENKLVTQLEHNGRKLLNLFWNLHDKIFLMQRYHLIIVTNVHKFFLLKKMIMSNIIVVNGRFLINLKFPLLVLMYHWKIHSLYF